MPLWSHHSIFGSDETWLPERSAGLTESISYRLKDEEIPKYWDKALDKIIEVTCRRIAHSKAGNASLIGEIIETTPAAKP